MAVSLGARYTGVIFAGGPRRVTVERAAEVLADVPATVGRVGVFGDQTVSEIVDAAKTLGLAAVQLHAGADASCIAAIRRESAAEVWTVCRVSGTTLPSDFADIIAMSDAVLLDALVPGMLGGTGVTLPWSDLAMQLGRHSPHRLILAGGLRPENVAQAIVALAPSVVDVSSGVEASPGIKDHRRMRAFRDAVSHIPIPT